MDLTKKSTEEEYRNFKEIVKIFVNQLQVNTGYSKGNKIFTKQRPLTALIQKYKVGNMPVTDINLTFRVTNSGANDIYYYDGYTGYHDIRPYVNDESRAVEFLFVHCLPEKPKDNVTAFARALPEEKRFRVEDLKLDSDGVSERCKQLFDLFKQEILRVQKEMKNRSDNSLLSSTLAPGRIEESSTEVSNLPSYWWVSANKDKWRGSYTDSLSSATPGFPFAYTKKNDNGRWRRIHRNFNDAKNGDRFIGYDSDPKRVCVLGTVVGNDDEKVSFRVDKRFDIGVSRSRLNENPVLRSMEAFRVKQASLCKLTSDEYKAILDMLSASDPGVVTPDDYEATSSLQSPSEVNPKESSSSGVSTSNNRGANVILYGVPGCGKSYQVEHEVLKGVSKEFQFRTTFYPDYYYTDFVGQVIPKADENDRIRYEFQPGPFTKALVKALENSDKDVYLIIEELNRGNAPAIFGDIFQLLDRVPENDEDHPCQSEFPIDNSQISEHLKSKHPEAYKRCCDLFGEDKIGIPSNLYIYATMNTSDQNISVLDNAFKRRWTFELVENEKCVYGNRLVPGLQNITWNKFVDVINKQMMQKQSSGLSISEDKQIGYYFVSADKLLASKDDKDIDKKTKHFATKVLEYLWNDVTRLNHKLIFADGINTFQDLVNKYEKGQNVFNPDIQPELPPHSSDDASSSNVNAPSGDQNEEQGQE